MKTIERSRCAISGADDLEPLYTFPSFPVFMGCSDQAPDADLRWDMAWWISRQSGLIQLKQLLPLDVLYPESHGAGAVGQLWDKHHTAFAHFLRQFAPRHVLEIGGAHGILATRYQAFESIEWTIVEPNPAPVSGCKARFIKGFFDERFAFAGACDTVVHSHVFEHIYDPNQFMQHVSQFMAPGQHLVFSLPNMEVMLQRKYTNCINFEHTLFLTEPYVEYLLAAHGFRLTARETFMDDHSIFYAAVRDPSVLPMQLPADSYTKNRKTYLDYIQHHQELIADLNQRVARYAQPVYLFGAHVFSQYLIAFGLDTRRIANLLDNDSSKQGKRLYGTNLTVRAPEQLRGLQQPAVILKAGVYNQEIKDDILHNINDSTIFLE